MKWVSDVTFFFFTWQPFVSAIFIDQSMDIYFWKSSVLQWEQMESPGSILLREKRGRRPES